MKQYVLILCLATAIISFGQTPTSRLLGETTTQTNTSNSIIFVDANASGSNDGTSWSNAYRDLNTALLGANSGVDIWVAAGTYLPHTSDRSASFSIRSGSTIYGGFDGKETEFSQRDIRANITTLSGDLSGDDNATVTDTESTRQDNSYHVVRLQGDVQNVTIDGFTISGGNASGSQNIDIRGAALLAYPDSQNDDITATVRNCIFEKNSGLSVGVYAPYFDSGDEFLDVRADFENCIFRNNYSGSLSTILFSGSNGFDIRSNGSLISCLFYDNVSASNSSCVYLGTSTASGGNSEAIDVDIINSTFANNTGVDGNVITMVRASNTTIQNSIVYGNGSTTPFVITSFGSSVTNSIVEGGQQSGTDSDPLFSDVAAKNFSLNCSSPAISAGDATGLTLPSLDVLGKTRINGTLDLGAIEFNTPIYTSITAVAKDFTIELDAMGNGVLSALDIDGGSGAACGVDFTLSTDISSFDCSDLGTHTVTLTATETVSGATSTATSTVTVVDVLAPEVFTNNITISIEANGSATISEADINNGSSDNCTASEDLIIALDITTFSCSDIGEQNVVLSVTDAQGNIGTALAKVIIEDRLLPTLVGQNITKQLGVDGRVKIIPSDLDNGSSDNCDITFSVSQSRFNCEDIGVNTVMLYIEDAFGNTDSTEVTVTIEPRIIDHEVSAANTSLCPGSGSSTVITLSGSELGLDYYFRDSEDNAIVNGPIAGAGTSLSFSSGVINETKAYHVYAAAKSYALDFAGGNQYVAAGEDVDFRYDQGYTFEMWVNSSFTTSNAHAILEYGASNASDVQVYVQAGSGLLTIIHNRTSSVNTAFYYPTPPQNKWAHIAITYDGGTSGIKVYYNGVAQSLLNSENPSGALLKRSGATLNIGRSLIFNSSDASFEGQMDEVRIWSKARAESDILADMNNGLFGSEPDLVSYFNFDEGEGLTAHDITGENMGTLTSMDASTDWVQSSLNTITKCGFRMRTELTIGDLELPSVIAQNITVELDADGNGEITAGDIDNGSVDNCTNAADLIYSLDVSNFSCEDIGTKTVMLTVTDLSNNIDSASATVTITDVIAPTVVTNDLSVILGDDGNASITPMDIDNGSTDNCTEGSNLTFSLDVTTFDLTSLGANTVTLTATDASGNSATKTALVTVTNKEKQTVTFTGVADKTFGEADFTISTSTNSDLAVTYTVISGGLAIESTNGNDATLSISGAGIATIEVTNDGDDTFAPLQETITIEVAKADQTLSIEEVTNKSVAAEPVTINASINTGLALTYSVTGPATNVDNEVTLDGTVGTVTVTVDQAGTDNYNQASESITFEVVEKQVQTITFTDIPDLIYGVADQTLNATASSGLAVTYALISGSATLSGSTLTITGVGTVVVEATQAGDENFLSGSAQQSIMVSKVDLIITADDQTINYGDAIPTLTYTISGFVNGEDANAMSSEPTISTSANATSDAGVYAVELAGGTAVNYNMTLVNATLTINKLDQVITLEEIDDKKPTDAAFDVVASVDSGLDLTYEVSGPATISGTTIVLDGSQGTVTVTVSQAGDVNHNAAIAVSITFEVSLVLALEEGLSGAIKIYPNPATEYVVIDSDELVDLRIFGLNGQLVREFTQVKGKVDVSSMKAGTYLMEVSNAKETTTVRIYKAD